MLDYFDPITSPISLIAGIVSAVLFRNGIRLRRFGLHEFTAYLCVAVLLLLSLGLRTLLAHAHFNNNLAEQGLFDPSKLAADTSHILWSQVPAILILFLIFVLTLTHVLHAQHSQQNT